jgi:TolB-like protein
MRVSSRADSASLALLRLLTVVATAGMANVLAASRAGAQEAAATVAVMDFTAFSVSLQDATALGKGLAGMLTTELSARPGLRMVERQQIRTLLDEQRLALSGRTEERMALEIGKLLGAEYLITGNLALAREIARLDVRVLRVATGEVIATHKRSGHPDDLFSVVVALAEDFSRDLELRATPKIAAERRVPIPGAALLAYSRGLDYEDRGERELALAMYEEALRLSPGYSDAVAARARLGTSSTPQ